MAYFTILKENVKYLCLENITNVSDSLEAKGERKARLGS